MPWHDGGSCCGSCSSWPTPSSTASTPATSSPDCAADIPQSTSRASSAPPCAPNNGGRRPPEPPPPEGQHIAPCADRPGRDLSPPNLPSRARPPIPAIAARGRRPPSSGGALRPISRQEMRAANLPTTNNVSKIPPRPRFRCPQARSSSDLSESLPPGTTH